MESHQSRNFSIVGIRDRWFVTILMVVFAVLVYPSCDPGKGTKDPKTKKEEDEKRDEGTRPETQTRLDIPGKEIQSVDQLKIPNTPAGQAILVHFEAAYAMGKNADSEYASSLDRLRREAPEVVGILTKAYGEVDQEVYADRWLILQTLADMKVEEALKSLVRFASAELPQRDTNQYDHNVSAYQEESILRITAIRGIADLAPTNDEAAESMVAFFGHKDPVIRLEALNSFADAIRATENRKRVAQLVKFLPRDYVFELQQVNPGPVRVLDDKEVVRREKESGGEAPIKR